jgi:hypothetical protein
MNKLNFAWYNIKCSTGEKGMAHWKVHPVVGRRRNYVATWKGVFGCNFPMYYTMVTLVVDTYR